jgi:hypothetical protein
MIEGRGQDKSCFFSRRDYRNEGHDCDKLSWILAPETAVPVARKLNMIEDSTQTKVVCFEQQITQRQQPRKSVLGLCAGKIVRVVLENLATFTL